METKNRNRYVHRIHFSGRAECALRHWPHCMRFCLFKHIAFAFVHRKNRQWKSGKPYISASRTLKIAERKKKVSNFVHWMAAMHSNELCETSFAVWMCRLYTSLLFFFSFYFSSLYNFVRRLSIWFNPYSCITASMRTSTQTDFEYIFFNGLKVKQCMICYLYAMHRVQTLLLSLKR